ncbi:MAG: hypothetical protein CMI55_04690 [Parcubacteria group bacterium]|jgi:hypothetical protein|nr:hypothetical protein [Parcubacteria group bacterium]|tara:strand:+ start:508 stop:1506 length:999 start_codon:yes stop_codon:yes gene_type:complete
MIGGSRTITSQGGTDNRIKKLSVIYIVTTDEISFYYGAQAGEGGILMGNNSQIEGNVFSNGSILPSGGGTSNITDTVTVAGNGNKIEAVNIGGDAYVHSCKDSDISGTLYYVSGGSIQNCTYTDANDMGPNEITAGSMPISDQQMNDWKDKAIAGGTITGDYILTNNASDSLGPIRITGNMHIYNNVVLTMTGLIYVEGDITIENNATVQLSSSFGSSSGLIISDGQIIVTNNTILQGSGQAGSFLMLASTNNSVDLDNPAIDIQNNATAAIFYASDGVIYLRNNINVREATGYMLALDNNAVISYDSGSANTNFSTGPGGSWQVRDWKEIE